MVAVVFPTLEASFRPMFANFAVIGFTFPNPTFPTVSDAGGCSSEPFRIYNGFNHQMFSHFLDNLVNFTSCRACIRFMTFFKPDVIVKFIFTFAYLLLPCL